MTRQEFIQQSLRSGLLVSLAPLDMLAPTARTLLDWTREAHRIFLYDAFVAGFRYYKGSEWIATLAAGDSLDLVREPENKHDSNAIAVYSNGDKLGFLPRAENYPIANLLDQKQILECAVGYTAPEEEPWNQLFVQVYLLIPSNPGYDAWIETASLL